MKTIRKRTHKTQYVQRVGLDGKLIPDTGLCAPHFRKSIYEAINADHPGKQWTTAAQNDCIICMTDFD